MNKTTIKSTESVGPLGTSEKNRQWQRELLMERLRSHSSQHKTFQELSRAIRMSMLEKRYALDAVEKANLQKCLDSMQHCIKVTTRQGLVERLESLSRQLGLKFMEDTSGLFISSDMFYLEIILDADGKLSDVKVHHECKIEQQSCSELVTCLLKGDFADFTVQLEGLSSIYQLNAEPKVKSKAFIALQAMETDLYNLFTIQNFHKDTMALLMDSSVGIVQKRRGGHSMKLIYFVPPYDLLNLETKSMQPLTIDLISTKNIGMSVSVNLEASSANKLQIIPTVTFNKDIQGESIPIYSSMNVNNSTLLPATFVLRLNTPLPICKLLMNTLTHLHDTNHPAAGSYFNDPTKQSSITDLIVQTASDGQIKNSLKGFPVNLPDQNHMYYFTMNPSMKGSIITSIPYTEPSQVPKILNVLRKQAIFHTLLTSCIRPLSKLIDIETTKIIEVNATSITQISVSLEHLFDESMTTIEFDLTDGKNISCNVYSLTNNYDGIGAKLSKIVQKSLSIPITVRALIKYWEQERMKGFHRSNMENGGNLGLSVALNDPGGGGGGGIGSSRTNGNSGGNNIGDFREIKIKTERGITNNSCGNNGSSGGGTSFNTDTSIDNRQFFHATGADVISNAEMMFGGSSNGFGFSTGEDFHKGPKSHSNNSENKKSAIADTKSDSSSLGKKAVTTTKSDVGVTSLVQKDHNNTCSSSCTSTSLLDKIKKDNKKNEIDNQKSIKTISSSLSKSSTSSSSSSSPMSITRVSTNELPSVLSGMGLDKRPGIEIVPAVSSANNQNFETSITITPITVSSSSTTKSVKKHSSSSSSSSSKKLDNNKLKIDKKRKRRKDDFDGQMGPPEKILSKSTDTINRSYNSVTVSSTPPSSQITKKEHSSIPNRRPFTTSPSSISSSLSNSGNSSGTKLNPKFSPVYPSPKSQSPKHSVSGSSGKPSMLALKSVTNSITSPKNDKTKSQSSKERSNDKDKDRSSVKNSAGSSPKIKSSTVKLKQIDLSAAFLHNLEAGGESTSTNQMIVASEAVPSESSSLLNTVTNLTAQSKLKKGSLSAVIDKLKSAQTSGDESASSDLSISGSRLQSGTSTLTSSLSSEYMIKPSLDGMKITINKTRAKDGSTTAQKTPNTSSSLSSINTSSATTKFPQSSGSCSPKRHTGLKPGVSSGPASKKTISATSGLKSPSSAPSLSNISGSSFQAIKSSFPRTSSAGHLATITKIQSSSNKDKTSRNKILGSGDTTIKTLNTRSDPMDVMKILRLSSPNSSKDGFMKSLNTKFQIPKLSARANEDSKKESTTTSTTKSIASIATVTSSSTLSSTSLSTSGGGNKIAASSDLSLKLTSSSNDNNILKQTMGKFSQNSTSSKNVSNDSNNVNKQQQSPGSHNTFGKVSQQFFPSLSPKYSHDSNTSTFSKDMSMQLSKSTSSDAILNIIQKDFNIAKQQLSLSTPTTPIHITSPFTSPVAGGMINSSPSYRSSPSVSPNVQNAGNNSNNNISCNNSNTSNSGIMRPPSAPCAIDMTKAGSSVVNEMNFKTIAPTTTTTSAVSGILKPLINQCLKPSSASIADQQSTSTSTATQSAQLTKKIMNSTISSSSSSTSHKLPSSVQVHIVKSPVPSPLMLLSSPHSNSPCITDEEMIDESLVGIKGK